MGTEAKKKLSKIVKSSKSAKPSKGSKAAKATKVTKAAKPAKAGKSVKAAKAVKIEKIVAKVTKIEKIEPKIEKIVPKPVKAAVVKAEAPFSEGDYVVYPTHGVGRVQAIERQKIAGHDLELFVITFDRDRMTLRVPVPKARQSGLRKLSSHSVMETALTTLRGRARVKRTMWSRRAQEYEAKINSGDPVSIAEVVRDLHRHANQPDQSYSERQIYEAALERLASELAAVDGIERDKATQKLEMLLDAA
jgi:CarD family transcriptional regulator